MPSKRRFVLVCLSALLLVLAFFVLSMKVQSPPLDRYVLDYDTAVDPALQREIEAIDAKIREPLGMTSDHAAAGLLDLRRLRLALIHPDRIEYAASVAKIGILLGYFQLRPDAATHLDPQTRHELGLMAKASNNELAAKFSRELGLKRIQEVLDSYHFYDINRGGGLWVGRHYGSNDERYGDPLANHSHAITVRQVLRFYLLLEQGKLVSPKASQTMREIFDSLDIPHDQIKFVKAIGSRPDVQILRKWGTWEDWLHDSAIVTGPSRHYILVGVTHHPRGDEYLEGLAVAVDDLMMR
jgi:beta-lactamase class A